MVFGLQTESKILFLHPGIEVLNKLVRRAGLLFHPTVCLKELFQRGRDIEEFFDLATGAAKPDERLITRTTHLVDDLPKSDLASGGRQLLDTRQTKQFHVGIIKLFLQRLIRIIARKIVERGAVDELETIVGVYQHGQPA